MNTKVRFVRCPRCWLVLPESAEVPVYKCGGCGTVLRAKIRKSDTTDTEPRLHETDPNQQNDLGRVSDDKAASRLNRCLHETDPAQKNDLEHVSDNKEASGCLNREATIPSTEDSALDKSSEGDHNEFSDCKRERLGIVNKSDELPSSTELTYHENGESSPEARAHMEADEDKCRLDQYDRRDQDKFGDDNRKQPGDMNFSEEISSSTELNRHETKSSSPVDGEHIELDESKNLLEQKNGRDENEFGEQPGDMDFSEEVSSSPELNRHGTESSSPVDGEHIELDDSENLLEQKIGRDENEFGEPPGDMDFSEEVSSSAELNRHGTESSSPVDGDHIELDESKNMLEQKNGRDENEIGEVSSSTELNRHGTESSSPVDGERIELDESKNLLEQKDGRDENEFGDDTGEQPGDMDFSKEVSSSTELNRHGTESSSPIDGEHIELDESKNLLEQKDRRNGRDENEFGGCSRESPGNIIFPKEAYSSTELTRHEIEETSQAAGEDTEVAENLTSCSHFRSSSAENLQDARRKDSIISAQRSLSESVLSDNLASPSKEQMRQDQNGVLQGFERVSSVDTLENIPLVNPRSQLLVSHREMANSPTTRSYYAYDGSESSCNETDYQVPDRHFHLSKRNFKDADFIAKGWPRSDDFMANNMIISESEMQHRAMNASSISAGKKHRAAKGSKWHQDELLEPTRHGHPVRSVMRLEKDEHLSRLPFYSRGSQAGPSIHGRNESQYSSSYYSPDKPEYPESDKVELLRMVYQLQDQLNRTHISKENVNGNGRFPARLAKKEKQISSYHGQFTREREIYPDLNYPTYLQRDSQGKIGSQQCKISRMAFSGEAAHCRQQERHFSAQLPPRVVCCNKGYYMGHHSHNCYDPYLSGPSSPPQYSESEFSQWSRDTKSDDLQHSGLYAHGVKKLNSRENHHSMKRHFRPIAGGSPVIACYQCLELLQLPADFLLFRRRCHQLRCGACSKVLKFSHQNRIHVVPYVPDAVAPPPSEVDDYTDTIKKQNLASASHASDCLHADPMSCSDDYGQSFCKSCSTEGDPFSLTPPFHTLERNSNDRKTSSGSSFEPMEDRKKNAVVKESKNKYKNSVETNDSVRTSSEMSKWGQSSSEIEELPPSKSSPLHRLMGYSSPGRVINR